MAVWTYTAHDLRSGVRLGELSLGQPMLSELLNRAGDLFGVVDLGARAASGQRLSQGVLDATRPRRTVIWCQRDGRLVDGYIIWSRFKAIGSRLLQIRGASLLSYFDHRLLTVTRSYTATDQHDIARDLVSYAQSQPGGDIGVVNDTTNDSGVLRDRLPIAYYYERKNIGQLLSQLAAVQGGFDYAITTDLVADVPTATFRCYYPRRGRSVTQANIVLGINLIDYSLFEDGTTQANSIHAIGAGEGTDMLITTATDTSEIDQGYPLIEDTISHKDVSVTSTLVSHAQAEIRRRAAEGSTWQLLVDPDDTSVPFGSWTVGDDVRVIIPDDPRHPAPAAGGNGLDTQLRIVGQVIRPNDSGGPDEVTLEMGALWTST
jgi:hypothetical protein